MASVAVNGTTLYYESRGGGPPVLFISGATGDAGHWTEVGKADLVSEYTVLSYDRRANSRSPRPENWTTAPIGVKVQSTVSKARCSDASDDSSATACSRSNTTTPGTATTLISGERHLRGVLAQYSVHYNRQRRHLLRHETTPSGGGRGSCWS
jgi:pimeloyl-ACP methyl ester carboxylesterase